MQTFLPYPDFDKSAQSLDNKRLGKQRVEAMQIHRALTVENYGWRNHPAVKMWKGYETALLAYKNACIREWIARGFNNTMELEELPGKYPLPPWLGDSGFHASHRSNLLRKEVKYYSIFSWEEGPDLEYVWPVKD